MKTRLKPRSNPDKVRHFVDFADNHLCISKKSSTFAASEKRIVRVRGKKHIPFILIGLLASIACLSAQPLRIVSYNVENLFHPKHDSVYLPNPNETDSILIEKDDWEWTPNGERRWSYTRYYRKIENIARVLTNIGEWDGVDVVGLQEVENALCIRRLCYTLRQGKYDFVHYESPDQRGIDVAFIYKKNRIDTIRTRAIKVEPTSDSSLKGRELITRDILYVCAGVKNGEKEPQDTLHFFVCHLPSQRGGKAESEWKRQLAQQILQAAIDSIYAVEKDAKIIVMGDMNSEPKDDLQGMKNRMNVQRDNVQCTKGTHKYHGQWSYLDQFYVSPAIDSLCTVDIYDAEWIQEEDEQYMGLKPKRTYHGYHYRNGYSDHLPIVMRLRD